MMQSASAPITSCWSASASMYLCEAAPAANSASFFALVSSLRSPASGPSRSSSWPGPERTSSISRLIAASNGTCPAMARFMSHPVMMRRLISLVPSKMRLILESR